PPPVVPEPPKRVHAVHVGEPQVEDDGVVVVLAAERNAFRAGAGQDAGVALLGQAAPEEGGHPGMVIDDQGTHLGLVAFGLQGRLSIYAFDRSIRISRAVSSGPVWDSSLTSPMPREYTFLSITF